MTLATFSFNYCMFKTQMTIVASSYSISTPWGPIFLILIIPLRWFENEVNGMFQYLAAFCKEVCPLSTMSIAFSRCWPIHLACLIALGIRLILIDLCICIMGIWHYCCVGVWTSCDCGVYYIVGMIGMIDCGGQFSCSTQVVLEMPFLSLLWHIQMCCNGIC